MLCVTWNVNSLKARRDRVLELLDLHRPDIVCLQETKVEPAAFPHDELAEAGYGSVAHSAGRWAGVAVLARHGLELEDVQEGLSGEAVPAEARWVEATVGGLHVISAYVPNGRALGTEAFEQKLLFLAAAGERVAELRGDQTVLLCGDMNVCPADRDVYDPAAFVGSTHVTAEERAALQSVVERGGLVDCFRALHPEDPGFTWWDYRQGHFHRKLGLRIDLALLSSSTAGGLRECGIDRNFRKGPKPSDHAPLLVELD